MEALLYLFLIGLGLCGLIFGLALQNEARKRKEVKPTYGKKWKEEEAKRDNMLRSNTKRIRRRL